MRRMKILALETENIKHLKVVSIKPDGSLVVVGGDNAQGKTCVLDSIEYALHGAGAIPSKPIRKGQKKARVVLDLGDIQVTRTFTEKGTNLTVKNKDGATFASPQAMLDKLVGELSFDPLEFSKMDAKKQTEVLKQLVGLDFDALNAKYKAAFDKRTDVNRRGRDLKGQLDNMILHKDAPEEEVSVKELGKKYTEALDNNREMDMIKSTLDQDVKQLDQLRARVKQLEKDVADRQSKLKGMKKMDADGIRQVMDEADTVNGKVRANRAYKEVDAQLVELRKESQGLTDQLNTITEKKEAALAKAKFPIKGLALDDDGVAFEGIPFTQCSAAQRIRVSVAIGLAMNPKLRVLLIREGSLLDSKNLKMVADMAAKADAQIWVERVSKGRECQVIIQDGEVSQKREKK